MLSTKYPPDLLCVSKLASLKSRESAPEKLVFQERSLILEETTAPNFSIRDYVFASRSKDLETSWPFTQHFLELCLKHGVKDLLPPFEPRCLVRTHCGRKGVEVVQPVICSEVEQILGHIDLQGEATSIRQELCSLLEKPSPDGTSITCQRISGDELPHYDAEIGCIRTHVQAERTSSEISEVFCSLAVNRGISEAPSEIEVVEPTKKIENLQELLENKCRLIVKLGAISKSSPRAEDIISNSSTVSDHPMASNVCPVCKKFSSTSNTTLNAHIDQCLSVESNTKWDSNKFLKSKVKPRKKRLMVDIYATAPCCTLEDLDRRNATNWAVELAFDAAPTVEVDMETKKPKLLPADSTDHANEAAIYVDSNGIELRILSKPNDTPQLKEELKLHKHGEVIEMSKKSLIRKKHFPAKYSKKIKVKSQRKKLNSFMLLKAQMQAAHKGDCNADTHHENEESLSHISDPVNLIKSSRSASLRQWTCSRRSDVPKKLLRKNLHSTSDNSVPTITRSRLAKSSQLDLGKSSVAVSHQLKLFRLSEDLARSPKTHSMGDHFKKSANLPISSSKWSSKSIVRNDLPLRISKSSGNYVASSRIKTKEIDLGIEHQYDNSSQRTNMSSQICCPSMKDQIYSTWEKNDSVRRPPFNLKARKGDLSEKSSAFKQFRKHRSISRSGTSGVEFKPAIQRGEHGTGVDIAITIKGLRSCEFDLSKCAAVSTAGEMTIHASPIRKDVPGREERDSRSTMEEKKHSTLKRLHPGTEYHDPHVQNLDMQVEVFDSGNHVSKPSMQMTAASPLPNNIASSQNLQATFVAKLEPYPLIEHAQSTSKNKVHIETLMERYEEQEVCCGDSSREEIDGQNIQIIDEVEVRGEKDSFSVQFTECTVDSMSIRESSGCLTSHGDVGRLEIPQMSTSITSVRTAADDAVNLASNGEPCGSPASATSTLSLPSSKYFKKTHSEAEKPLPSAINAQDKWGLTVVPITDYTVEDEERNVHGRTQELKANRPANELDHSLVDKPFCCSCRESISRESQLLRPNATHGTTRGKQASNLFARPRESSAFSLCQDRRTNAMLSSSLQPAAQSISTKGLSDSADKVPTHSGLGSVMATSQSNNQSISNPILRLMGKNLMVVKNKEFDRPQSTVFDCPPHVNYLSPHGFSPVNNDLLKQENFRHHRQFFGGSLALDSVLSMGEHQFLMCVSSTPMAGFSVAPLSVPRPDQQTQKTSAYTRG